MPFHLLNCVIALSLLLAVSAPLAFAQSQALNGQIEGTVLDQVNAAVPNAVITVTNIETGATRTVTTDQSGVYRFPLLPLGTYRITAEANNFKKLHREGITLTTGQIATVDLNLQAMPAVLDNRTAQHRRKIIGFQNQPTMHPNKI